MLWGMYLVDNTTGMINHMKKWQLINEAALTNLILLVENEGVRCKIRQNYYILLTRKWTLFQQTVL
jgi:hypothetical protein